MVKPSGVSCSTTKGQVVVVRLRANYERIIVAEHIRLKREKNSDAGSRVKQFKLYC